MRHKRTFLIAVLVLLVIAACGGGETEVAEHPLFSAQHETAEVEGEPLFAEVENEQSAPTPRPLATATAGGAIAVAPAPAGQARPPQPFPTPPRPPQDNFFENYGVNPYVPSAVDRLSTFSLDVDTGAYAVARRYLRDGLLPPADAVRVEEFVNYFEQDYPLPPEAAFALYADGAPSPFHYDGSYLLRIGVQGYDVPPEQRPSAALTFVIDVSGSMGRENRLELVKRSLQLLVDRLRPDDTVAIVVYGSTARTILEPTRGDQRATILNAIYALWPEGSTNAEAGLRIGYQLANAAYRPGGINRVILASDGVANVGVTDPDALSRQIRSYADGGITLTTVGFGMGNFNDVLMEQLADQGDGAYAYVDTLAEAQKLFVEDLTGTLQVIALDAKIQVDFNPDTVLEYRLIGYENRAVADQDFRNDSVDAGEIGAGHTATALYAIRLAPAASGRLATVQLRWRDPNTGQVQEINGNVNDWDLAARFEEASPRFRLAAVVAQFAELLRHSYWSGDATFAQVGDYAQRLAGQLSGDPDVAEFAALTATARRLAP